VLGTNGNGQLEGLEQRPQHTWNGFALGAAQGSGTLGYSPLPGVTREVCGVVRDGNHPVCHTGEGVMPGQRYLNAEFNEGVLRSLLSPQNAQARVLHIATHYRMDSASLLLGDQRTSVKLDDMKAWQPRLGQYDLIALSACETGRDNVLYSLGHNFRAWGAKAVLATLWPVADVGAGPLMVEFYRQRGAHRQMSKSEALQKAQLAMLRGQLRPETGPQDLSHPYYWAPYVLMGNWL
jgi:CHAT domain-containing protein